MKKYYPQQWRKMDDFRTGYIASKIEENIKEGKEEKLFREEVNPKIISQLYISLVQSMLNTLGHPENPYDFKTLHKQMVNYHLYGICTPTGINYLEQHINEI
jgi:hypothetical protein